MRMPSG